MSASAVLVLEDGSVFAGVSIGVEGCTVGEVVFNTAMTGYQEILTDPSYSRQIVTLTYPHIGNTGTNRDDAESSRVYVAGLIVRDLAPLSSNWRNQLPLDAYLKANHIVGLANIDTRRLTRILREKGAMKGCMLAGEKPDRDYALTQARAFPGLKGLDLAKEVTTTHAYTWTEGSLNLSCATYKQSEVVFKVAAYDYGIKRNILRILADKGCLIKVYPATTPADELLAAQPDGIFLSNGPGDPAACRYAIDAIREILQTDIPVFGICLGHQLLALASDASTQKMKFGHHGANHPVQDLKTGRVMITSQNHGFAVDDHSLPATLRVTHRSLFDGSLQGIERTDKPAFSFQGHPEASPGPNDAVGLFDRFIQLMQHRKTSQAKSSKPENA